MAIMMPVMLAMAQVAAQPTATPMPVSAITDSVAGWNANDLDRFMAAYADDAIYVTEKGVVRGKSAITAHYAPSFTGKANSRGTLTIEPLVERMVDPTHRFMVGRWTLHGKTPQTGLTSLLFERRGREWKIITDHSS